MKNYFDDKNNDIDSKFNDYYDGPENETEEDSFLDDYTNDYVMHNSSKRKDADKYNSDFDDIDDFLSDFDTNQIHTPAKSKYYRTVTENAAYKKKQAQTQRIEKRRKRNAFGRFVAIFLCAVFLITVGLGSYVVINTNKLMSKINYLDYDESKAFVDQSTLQKAKGITNILVMGLDDDGSGTFRSDSMILVSLDTVNKKIKLTSFLRDMWVEIPNNYSTKMNASFVLGGAELVIDTIEYNFGVDIDNYVFIDYQIFQNIVDELGGIEVDISDDVSWAMEEFNCIVEPGSNVHLNGEQTMWYARVRHCDSDFGRTSRQREVITLLIDKLKKKNIKELYTFSENVLSEIKTGLTKNEIKSLVIDLKKGITAIDYLSYDIEQCSIPADGYWHDEYIGDQAALVIDLEENCRILKEFIYG